MCPNISTDDLMWNVYNYLHFDLFQHVGRLPAGTITEAREREGDFPQYVSPYEFKCRQQVSTWLKRYRFEDDIYTERQLEERTNDKFVADQLRIGQWKPLTYRTKLVLQRARQLIKGVLGTYNEEDIFPYCSFSINGTVGYSGKDVYLDRKINPDTTLTGTKAECKWFTNHLRADHLLAESCTSNRTVKYALVNSLKQVNVPKTAKIHRSVRPNTLIGSFRSIGLGKLVTRLIRERLGINLNHLQAKHQRLAKTNSVTLNLVTADLSSASDSFTPALLNRLLPRSWYNALKLGRTPYVEVGGQNLWSPSFMAMGIGYTFPVMTLCFYAILKAIQELSGTRGKVSVFGDDLIYPTKIHYLVTGVFDDLNFRLNMDKTFTLAPFRESCGGDYYKGLDVRPARPEGVSEVLEGKAISAYVYKLFNSLIRRWEFIELPFTFGYLLNVLKLTGESELHVPDDFPDTSGLKDGRWREFAKVEEPSADRRKPFYNGLLIPCLHDRRLLRPVGHMGIYMWNAFRTQSEAELRRDPELQQEEAAHMYAAASETLIWKPMKGPRVRSKLCPGKSYRKLVAFTTKRGTRLYQPASTLYNR